MTKTEFQNKMYDYVKHFEPIEPYIKQVYFTDMINEYTEFYDLLSDRTALRKKQELIAEDTGEPDMVSAFMDFVHNENDLFEEFKINISLLVDAGVVCQTKEINGKIYDPHGIAASERRYKKAVYKIEKEFFDAALSNNTEITGWN